MRNRISRLPAGFLAAVLAAGFAPLALAQHDHAAAAAPAAKVEFKGDPYLLSTDPVSGAKLPEKPVIYQHQGRELRFADAKNVDMFKADPAKYLAAVDAELIKQQTPFYPVMTCVVSNDKLGGDMGKAIDVIYRNRLVRFCCKDCVNDFNKDPGKFIAMVDKAVIAKQTPAYAAAKCLVSDEKLGGDMGKPVDLVVGNRLVRFCCAACVDDFNANPTKFLTKLDQSAARPAR